VKVDLRSETVVVDPPRFARCRHAIEIAAGPPGATESSPYRRCPVGVIATVDCPEYVGRACGFQEDRGDAAPAVVPAEEVTVLAAELSRDFLTPAYARRLAALRAGPGRVPRGAEILVSFPVVTPPPEPPPVRRTHLVAPGPVNVSPDGVRAHPPRSPR
jgi:hypothetical protein